MVWHLFIIAVLGGLINVAFRYHPFNVIYEKSCAKIQKKFGDINYSEKGLRPTVNPTERGTVYLEDFRVDYFPSIEELKDFKPDDDYNYWIIWTPKSVLYCILVEGKLMTQQSFFQPTFKEEDTKKGYEYLRFLLNNNLRISTNYLNIYESAELFQISKEYVLSAKMPVRNLKLYYSPASSISIPNSYISSLFFEIFTNCLVSSPIYILIFSLFSFFLGKSNMLSLKFSQLFVVGIYTGFPGFVIATLYTGLDLPVLDFQSVFLMSYLFYSFPVFGRLRWDQMQKENQNRKDSPDQQ